MSSRLSQLRRKFRLEAEEETEEEETEVEQVGIFEGAGLRMTGGALVVVGERAEQEEEERGLLTGQSSRRTHTSSDGLARLRPLEPPLLPPPFAFLQVPLDRIPLSSSLRPFSLDSEDADSTDDWLPVLFQVPTRGSDVECFPPPPLPALLFSRFQVPVRLKRDEATSCGRDGLSEWERLMSCLLAAAGRGVSGLLGDSGGGGTPAAAADSSNFLFSVGLGVSLMKVDWRTSAGFSGSALGFFATRDADSLLGMPPPTPFEVEALPGLACLEAEDEEDDALPGDAVRGSWGSFPPF